jgi:hypothetical protein
MVALLGSTARCTTVAYSRPAPAAARTRSWLYLAGWHVVRSFPSGRKPADAGCRDPPPRESQPDRRSDQAHRRRRKPPPAARGQTRPVWRAPSQSPLRPRPANPAQEMPVRSVAQHHVDAGAAWDEHRAVRGGGNRPARTARRRSEDRTARGQLLEPARATTADLDVAAWVGSDAGGTIPVPGRTPSSEYFRISPTAGLAK